MTRRGGGERDQHGPNPEDIRYRQHHGFLRDQLACLVRRMSWLTDSMTTTVFPNLPHHGQNRGQKTGAPVTRRNSDEITLLLRKVTPSAAGFPQAKSRIRQSGMNLSLGDSDTLNSMPQIPYNCHQGLLRKHSREWKSGAIPQKCPLTSTPGGRGGRRGGDFWRLQYLHKAARIPTSSRPRENSLGPRECRPAEWEH